MARLLITTVGTSLLTNRDTRPWAGWNGRNGDPLPDENVVQEWLTSADLVAVSAETNSLRSLCLESSDSVLFLHSDTPEGRFCSNQLCNFYSQNHHLTKVEEKEIKALGYQHESFAQRGLRSIVSIVIEAIKSANEKGHQPIFCATGGFKAEIAFLNIIGALLNIEVFYIHDQFREVVRLPRLPLDWDANYVVQHRDFFNWIDSEPRTSHEVESWLKSRPELRSLVEDSSDGYTYLNAAGDLLYRAASERLADRPRVTWPPGVASPPSEKNGVSTIEHHRPKGWEKFVNRLCEIDCVRRVAYDEAAYGGSTVKVLDAASGVLTVRYGSPDSILPLRVDTTANGEAQIELVAEYIRGRIV
jgi:putative CRISPR-associated protein (TIGR02619 family)